MGGGHDRRRGRGGADAGGSGGDAGGDWGVALPPSRRMRLEATEAAARAALGADAFAAASAAGRALEREEAAAESPGVGRRGWRHSEAPRRSQYPNEELDRSLRRLELQQES